MSNTQQPANPVDGTAATNVPPAEPSSGPPPQPAPVVVEGERDPDAQSATGKPRQSAQSLREQVKSGTPLSFQNEVCPVCKGAIFCDPGLTSASFTVRGCVTCGVLSLDVLRFPEGG